ncbi:MAG: aminotransferase class V-fold PLP-dependent enzyme [Holophagales bacterium]|nr:aminotransferase class V-fold PLP-dependent enzyme [Holophagales bacterium]
MTLRRPVYLDHQATTPLDPRVLEAMLPWLMGSFGNASSRQHAFGWEAGSAVAVARETVAEALGAEPREIVFTSGATESNNLALLGAARAARGRGDHVVTSAVEHRAVLDPCRQLAAEGFDVTVLDPDETGRTAVERVEAALTTRTILVSLMAASNEIGTLNPVAEIAALCASRGVLFHTDAAQAFGKAPFDVRPGVALASLSAHKLYGPKGVGALYVRARPIVRLAPLVFGGGHERGLRSGTVNVPGIVGFGAAVRIAVREREEEAARLAALRRRLDEGIRGRLDGVTLNGPPIDRLPGNLSLSFGGVGGERLLASLRDLAVSSGSACSTAEAEPSHVLLALGVPAALAKATIRFGLGRFTTGAETDFAAATVVEAVLRLRADPSLTTLE